VTEKYADYFMDVLKSNGYTHCFFIGGGNILHLVEAARRRFTCVPVVHEVSACIAAEYFNEVSDASNERAFALVTAGPGATNCATGVAAAWLESRELLLVGGQARVDFISDGSVRQIGHQEINAIDMFRPVTKEAERFTTARGRLAIEALLDASRTGRKGPVFIEICLDVSAYMVSPAELDDINSMTSQPEAFLHEVDIPQMNAVVTGLRSSERPVILLGGGVSRAEMAVILPLLRKLGAPIMTTWNGADRIGFDDELYAGRPNTYGMRFSNLAIQQSDFVVAVGTRLGLQQTGFAWEDFVPLGTLVQVDIDQAELDKGHPKVDIPICADATNFLHRLLSSTATESAEHWHDWRNFVTSLRDSLPLCEEVNSASPGHIEAYRFVTELSGLTNGTDQVIPCSSGGAFTIMMQAFANVEGQVIVTDKGHASMGYGLPGAIGAALRNPDRRTILVEGDGGFAQNMQEVGTAVSQRLNLKIFILDNDGYASIKTSLKSYFAGAYIGCDAESGLGLPDWLAFFSSFKMPTAVISETGFTTSVQALLAAPGPAAFVVKIDPEQQFFPKITSRMLTDGSMASNPLHRMTPPLTAHLEERCSPWLLTK
jgi:acetolactate synthase-1/2/3 large subunit